MTVLEQVEQALEHVPTGGADAGAIALVKRYAAEIDEGGDLTKLGPPLLTALEALGMTPRARAAVAKKGGVDGPAGNPLDELRQRREQRLRQRDAAALDASAS